MLAGKQNVLHFKTLITKNRIILTPTKYASRGVRVLVFLFLRMIPRREIRPPPLPPQISPLARFLIILVYLFLSYASQFLLFTGEIEGKKASTRGIISWGIWVLRKSSMTWKNVESHGSITSARLYVLDSAIRCLRVHVCVFFSL